MNNILKLFSIAVLMLVCAGCAGSSDTYTLQDQFVKSRLTGTWSTVKHYTDKKETIRFDEDNTFIDTVYYKVPDLPGSFYVRYVAAGNYSINDMKIVFTDVKFRYYKNLSEPLKTRAVEFFDPRLSDFQDEFVFFRRSVSLRRDGKGKGLEDKWLISHLAAVYDAQSVNKFGGGIVAEEFDFLPGEQNSEVCRYRRRYLFETSLPDQETSYRYIAKQSYLNIDSVVNTWYSINGNEMVWYDSTDDNLLYEKVK